MPQKPRAYHRPSSLEEALKLLGQPDTVPLAGGTALLATEEGITSAVVDLQDAGLGGLAWADSGHLLRIGAMARLAELETFLAPLAPLEGAAGLLRDAVHRAGPNTYRNMATTGGIIASRLPDSEFLAALLVLDATVSLRLPSPEVISLATYLEDDEQLPGLITEILVFWPNGKWAAERVARTPADSPIVSVAAWRPSGGTVRLAATGVHGRPVRLREAEKVIAGQNDEEIIAAASEVARQSARHPGDFRGDAGYRAQMAAILTRRVLKAL
jgi:carbon-monoxide dehydrogenase medium subunit